MMFVPLQNTPVRYAWGSHGAISDLLGTGGVLIEPETGEPLQAELWLGAHHGSPTRVTNPDRIGGAATIREWIATNPETALGSLAASVHPGETALPYLFKVLAAAKPLSLQVHPTLEQARAGFAAENDAGIPLTAPERNYRDSRHKPELLVALSEQMTALAGFAELGRVRALVAEVAAVTGHSEAFAPFVAATERFGNETHARELLRWVLTEQDAPAAAARAIDDWVAAGSTEFPAEHRNLAQIRAEFPGDPSALIALLMNHVTLHRGEAMYIRAGVLHAYLHGLGAELMAASDNVLRGGLTPKHIDVPELLRVLDVRPTPTPMLAPTVAGLVATFAPVEPDFRLQRAAGEALADRLPCPGPGIALCVAGSVQLTGAGSGETKLLGRGDAVYVTPDEGAVQLRGRGDVLLATVNLGDPADSQEVS